MKNQMLKLTLWIIVVCLVIVRPAHASYIDPNTGGMLFQILAVIFGVLSGIVLIFSSRIKMLIFRIIRLMNGSKGDQPSQEDGTKE